MRLGDIAEISLAVSDFEAAASLFESLGFTPTETIQLPYPTVAFTDGDVAFSLHEARFNTPSLTYYGSNLSALLPIFNELNMPVQELQRADGQPTAVSLEGPDGLRIVLSKHKPERHRTHFNPSRCGSFSEFVLPVENLRKSSSFWTRFGHNPAASQDEPYSWQRLTDGCISLGLHETNQFNRPAPLFYASDASQRIQALQDEVEFFQRSDEHAAINAPGGMLIFIFQKAAPSKTAG